MTEGHRRAALALHSLTEADRAWVMAQLSAAHQSQLEACLSELTTLGIPSDPQWAVLAAATPCIRDTKPQTIAESADTRLRNATADDMLDVLVAEPASLVGLLLSLEPWPWAEDYTARLGTDRRARVRAAMHDQTVGQKLRDALVEAVGTRLAQRPAVGELSRSAAPWWRVAAWSATLLGALRR